MSNDPIEEFSKNSLPPKLTEVNRNAIDKINYHLKEHGVLSRESRIEFEDDDDCTIEELINDAMNDAVHFSNDLHSYNSIKIEKEEMEEGIDYFDEEF